MDAVILAGGQGLRLRSVVADLPKPLAPVLGVPFLAHLLDHWAKQGISRFILALCYQHEKFRQAIGNTFRGIPVAYSIEGQPLGTGGGIAFALSQLSIKDPFLCVNGDTWCPIQIEKLLERATTTKALVAMVRAPTERRYGMISCDQDGRITSLSGETTSADWINAGVYLFKPAFFSGVSSRASLETDLFPEHIKAGDVYGVPFEATPFLDIGMPEDYRRASLVLKGKKTGV